MAFAQFYYDPALEFEKLLDEGEELPVAATSAAANSLASVPISGTLGVVDGNARKGSGPGAIARSTSATAELETQPQTQPEGGRWFGGGLLRRCASTGSIHGGTHPGIPK